MIRATTPTHIFLFDENPSLYERVLITYSQNGKIIMEKEKDDLTIEVDPNTHNGYKAYYRLTQEETKKFQADGGKNVLVQVRVLTTSKEALASEKKSISVYDVLNDEVLV